MDVTLCHWVSECGRLKGSYSPRIQGQVVRVPLDPEDEGVTIFDASGAVHLVTQYHITQTTSVTLLC